MAYDAARRTDRSGEYVSASHVTWATGLTAMTVSKPAVEVIGHVTGCVNVRVRLEIEVEIPDGGPQQPDVHGV